MVFRSQFNEDIFHHKKYSKPEKGLDTWEKVARCLAEEVCGGLVDNKYVTRLAKAIAEMKFIPGGRYIYYSGRDAKFYNNCFLLSTEEDTREDWASLSYRVQSCLMTGGGIGVVYDKYRPSGSILSRTGGEASGPISQMMVVNEIGRYVKQGGSRRSAIWGGLSWWHGDVKTFLKCKDWDSIKIPGTDKSLKDLKFEDFNYPAPLDCTNISVLYDDDFLKAYEGIQIAQGLSVVVNCGW